MLATFSVNQLHTHFQEVQVASLITTMHVWPKYGLISGRNSTITSIQVLYSFCCCSGGVVYVLLLVSTFLFYSCMFCSRHQIICYIFLLSVSFFRTFCTLFACGSRLCSCCFYYYYLINKFVIYFFICLLFRCEKCASWRRISS